MGLPLHSVALDTTTCCVCGVVFGMPDYLLEKRRENGAAFFCPNGHNLSYTKSEVVKLREALEQQKKRTEFATNYAAAERRAREAAEKKLKRAHTRIEKGVCPHCNRHFTNLERHMQTKHVGKVDSLGESLGTPKPLTEESK